MDNYNVPEQIKEKIKSICVAKRTKRNIFGINTTVKSHIIALNSDYLEEYMTLSGVKLSNWLIELIYDGGEFGIDVDSISTGVYRMYINGRYATIFPFAVDYPFNYEMPDEEEYKYQGFGFFYDSQNDIITSYKHYFVNKTNKFNILNYHFTQEKEFDYLGSEESYNGRQDFIEESKYYRESGEWHIRFIQRLDVNQKYMIAHRTFDRYEMQSR